MQGTADGTLNTMSVRWYDDTALTVVMASKGYPGAYEKGSEICGLEAIGDEATVFHAGTSMRDGKLIATGGRVLCVTGLGANVREAADRAYAGVAKIDWPGGFNRSDIGWQAIAREEDAA